MRRLIVAGICVLAGLPAYAEPVLLGDATLKQAVAGKTVHLNTPFGRSLVTTEPAETARAASTALPVVKIRQAPKAAAPRAVAAVEQTPPRQPQSDTGAKLSSASHGRLPMATEHLARAKQDDRWC